MTVNRKHSLFSIIRIAAVCVYTWYNLFAHSSCTSLFILVFIKSTVILYCTFYLYFSYYFYFIFYFLSTFIYIFSCVVSHILHCPLSGPVLIYISLLIIFCIIEYVTNKKTLNLEPGYPVWNTTPVLLSERVAVVQFMIPNDELIHFLLQYLMYYC